MVSYSLARFGHDNVLLLDGGLQKWKAVGSEITRVFPDGKWSITGFRSGTSTLWSRGVQRDRGSRRRRPSGRKASEVLRGRKPLVEAGPHPRCCEPPLEETIVCSCGTGREATNEFILFKWRLGYPKVRLYESSYTEGTSHPKKPHRRRQEPPLELSLENKL
jgi:thiosulfate/3-mercaptopyruvate sulfurtransferase